MSAQALKHIKEKAAVTRIGGANRYEVSANIVNTLNMNASKVSCLMERLCGCAGRFRPCCQTKHPLLLVQAGSLPTPVADVVAKRRTQSLLCLGDHLDHGFIENSLADMFTGDGYSVNVSSGKLVLYKIIEPSNAWNVIYGIT
ncbi:cell wall-binding repeat-containing protein [Bacillus licheniformis]|nr:cell wall-binding repeat-containing protein [Bacillus licheniformis]